ncbi:cupin-like domain-containing protein [Phaeodactylibacter luteus]|uniref:Cupin-like domain-containing protein n=2 Tax=Phaeodactylibacter luteus TaxID=1564516 RepID=A0A5C6RN70_9BACT|nr:cupin-like domain-containing protein [Phaeodactylibacter luteus]
MCTLPCPITFNKTLETMPIDYSRPVPRVKAEDLTRERFEQEFLLPNRPVVIEGLLKGSAAYHKWSMDFFRKEMGELQVGIFDDIPGKEDRSFKSPDLHMKFGEYLDLIEREPTNKRIFLFNLFKHRPELKKDVVFPDIVKNWNKNFRFTFFGGKDSVVRIHQDMDMANVFLTQFHGAKRVILFDPSYSDLLYRYPFGVHSSVDVEHPDYETYPGLHHVKGYETEINNGDTLFIPSGYWHHIVYLEGGFAMALRSWSPHTQRYLRGLLNVGLITHLDEALRYLFGKRWFAWKKAETFRRANRAIQKSPPRKQEELATA